VICARREKVLVGAYVDYYTQESLPLFELYDFVVCNTRRHHAALGRHPQALYVPWGTDCDLYRPRTRSDRPLTFFHSAGQSGPNDRKGTGMTLEAFRAVRGDVRLVVHAQFPLSSAPSSWRSAAQADRRIEYRHATEKPPGLYHLGDVYWCADHRDEALGMGQRARATALERLDWNTNGALLSNALTRVVKREPAAELEEFARLIDRRSNPTPMEQWTSATRRIVGYAIKRAT
jgi:glycosyltransferase involved in cell wall biosynthesis